MRSLVLYYSNTGNTRKVAEFIAGELHAELGEITSERYSRWYGPLAMAWGIFTRALPPIDVTVPADALYDLIVVGGPVWAARAAPPVLSFLSSRRVGGARYGLFVTCSGTGPKSPPEPAIAEMARFVEAGASTAIFREKDIRSGAFIDDAVAFARELAEDVAQANPRAAA
jgi:hypothetical protein